MGTKKLIESLNESVLTEKINRDNIEINNLIRKALRSKSEARKLEPELAKHGITVDYNFAQGTVLRGKNGKILSDDRHNIYGPSAPGFDNTHKRTDSKYSRYSKLYKDDADRLEQELNKLKDMSRDDIIRKYNTMSTEDALKAHEEDIENTTRRLQSYIYDSNDYAKRAEIDKQRTKSARRRGHIEGPSYDNSIPKDSHEYIDRDDSTIVASTPADKVDYLTYLTKEPTGYRDDSGKAYDSEDVVSKALNSKVNGYKNLKNIENNAKDSVDFRKNYYKVQSDDELKAMADNIRASAEGEIENNKKKNELNKKYNQEASDKLDKAKKDVSDYMERIRNSRNKRESEEFFVNHRINESAKAKRAKLLESIKARKQSIINEAATDNKYHSKSINDYEDSSEVNSAINDDISTIDNTMNELKYRVNLNETISLIDSYKDQLLQAVSDLNSTEELTETSDRELEAMKNDLRTEKVQALKDAGDKNPENTIGIAKRLPEEVWKELKIKGDTLSAIQMIHSILAYSNEKLWTTNFVMNNRYMQSYINSLGEDTVRSLVDKEIADFKDRATVNSDTYTDSEGVSYNSINWKD